MPAFIFTAVPNNDFRFLSNPALALDPAGFDVAGAEVFFRGTETQFLAKFPIGGLAAATGYIAPSGSIFYCLGPQGRPVRKHGHITAQIEWKGILSSPSAGMPVSGLTAGDHAKSVSLAMTTNETMWPQERDGNVIAAGTPYAPNPPYRIFTLPGPGSLPITTGAMPYRVRLIGRTYSAGIRGITVGTRSAIMRAPRCTILDPTILDNAPNWQNFPDPLVTWSKETGTGDGWLCRNYQRSSEYTMGDKVLAFWTADYEWIERYSP